MPEGSIPEGPIPEGSGAPKPLDPAKFKDPVTTARGEVRAWVDFARLETLWFNTGSLCNIACGHCYMESGPKKDDLAYLAAAHVTAFLDEIKALSLPTREVGFTGGEPFMNKALPAMLADALSRGHEALVLTNAMQPLWQRRPALLELKDRFGTDKLTLRVSVDHPTAERHDVERGQGAWASMEQGVLWLIEHGFRVDVAGRKAWLEDEAEARRAYQGVFETWGLDLDATDPARLVLFPEMDETQDVPEITTACWGILGVRPDQQMCANARMVVLRKSAERPVVTPCTLLPYDPAFDLGSALKDAFAPVRLNHPHCANFCVLGGARCSS